MTCCFSGIDLNYCEYNRLCLIKGGAANRVQERREFRLYTKRCRLKRVVRKALGEEICSCCSPAARVALPKAILVTINQTINLFIALEQRAV